MFYREKAYTRINWKNRPNLSTPLGAKNLNKMDETLNELDDRILEVSSEVERESLNIVLMSGEINALKEDVAGNTSQINELSNLAEDVNGLKIVNTASGSPVYIDDASNMGFERIDLYGESKQESTSGKNLLDCSGLAEKTASGVKFTPVFENGVLQYISADGNAEENVYYTINNTFSADEDSKYILNGCPVGGSSNTYHLAYYEWNSSWSQKVRNIDGGNGIVLNHSSESSIYQVRIVIAKGTSCNNLVFKPMIRLATITDSTYEPYTGGKSSPNPDYPQPIESKVIKEIVSYTGQLFNKDNALYVSGISADVESGIFKNSQPQVRIYYVEANPNTTYTFSKTIGGFNRVCTCPNIPSESGKITNFNADTTNNVATITTGENDRYIAFYPLLVAEIDSIGYDSVIDTVMISYGVKALPYSQYKPVQTVNIFSPIELHGLGDIKDRIVKKNGLWGVERNIAEVDMGTLTYTYDANKLRFVTTTLANSIKKISDESIKNNILSESYTATSFSELYNSDLDGIMSVSSSGNISIRNKAYTDITEFKNAMAGIKLLYELATPTFEPLPQDDINAIKSLHSYKPNTVVMNDADAEMDVEYVADAKAYIDNKFRELATVIVNQ